MTRGESIFVAFVLAFAGIFMSWGFEAFVKGLARAIKGEDKPSKEERREPEDKGTP